MRKPVLVLVTGMVLVIGYIAVGPFIAFHHIRSAIDKQDPEMLSEDVDFATLRQNLKEQLNATVMKETAASMRDNIFGGLALALLPRLVDSIVDSYVTPSGLAAFMQGRTPGNYADRGVEHPQAPPSTGEHETMQRPRYSYDSMSKFSVWLPMDNGGQIRLVFTRDILKWRLTNIVAPMAMPHLDEHESIAENQAYAVGSLRTLDVAEMTYSTTYNVGYSSTLASLDGDDNNPTASAAGLIDSTLASGIKNGYRFIYSAGKTDSSGHCKTYTINADPLSDETGINHYFTDESGVIRQNAIRPATSTDTPLRE